jgi:hypothetical protein
MAQKSSNNHFSGKAQNLQAQKRQQKFIHIFICEEHFHPPPDMQGAVNYKSVLQGQKLQTYIPTLTYA